MNSPVKKSKVFILGVFSVIIISSVVFIESPAPFILYVAWPSIPVGVPVIGLTEYCVSSKLGVKVNVCSDSIIYLIW